ncbi:MAG: PA14 domain-containing protein [Lentisphaerales bacterium]|nr:PA14 domain-containing protein [Lentisphaerales bacterium]
MIYRVKTFLFFTSIAVCSAGAIESLPEKPVKEEVIPLVEKMAKMPKPYIMRDWPEVSQKYYKFVLRPNYELDGKLLMSALPKGKKVKSFPISSEHIKTKSGKPGWSCEFFPNKDFKGTPTVKRVDSEINFKWGHKPPVEGIKRDHFSVRWQGSLTVPESRKYKFSIESDDGARVLINGKPLFDNLKGSFKASKEANLKKGKTYEVTVEYVEQSGEAKILFNWGYISPKAKAKMLAESDIDMRMPSYRHSKPAGEIFTNISAIVGAKMVGLDPEKLTGFDVLNSSKQWYDAKHGIYRHGPGQKNPDLHSGIYGYWSSVYGIMLADLFPEDPDFLNQAKTATKTFKTIAKGLGCPEKPDFDNLGFNFETNGPGGRNEPMNRLGNSPIIAWMNLMGYDLHKDKEMLQYTKSIMDYYTDNPGRYELTHVMAPYVATRLNAQHGKNYDITPIYSTWFGDGIKKGWKITAGMELDGVTVDGIDGALHKNGFLCFTMGTLNGPAWLLPALRYDQRHAKSIARYNLNMAVSMRLFQGYKMDWEHQDHKEWKDKYDPEYLLFYEALFSSEPSKERKYRPYATGDPIRLGWGVPKVERQDYLKAKGEWISKHSANISFYMGNHVGLLGAICHPTDVPGIIRWDCLKTEWLAPKAFPTLLYHNPHNETKEITLKLDDQVKGKVNLYDSISGKFISKGTNHGDKLELKPDQAVILVAVPQGAKLSKNGKQLLANGVVIDYRADR